MKYIIVDQNKEFDDIDDVLDYCIDDDWHDDDDYFEEWVNDGYGHIEIAGYRFDAYDIANSCDDCCYNDLKNEFCNSMNEEDRDNARYELRNSHPGDTVEIQAYTVEVANDDEEEEEEVSYSSLEDLKNYIMEQQTIKEQKELKEKEEEKDFMDFFQKIGG